MAKTNYFTKIINSLNGKKVSCENNTTIDLDTLTFGGERVSHLYPNDCYYAHLSIYYFALKYVENRNVLDAGSGSGYGTDYLAKNGASSVIGIDISSDAITFCQNYFKRDNLQYKQMDLQNITGFTPHNFDVIFSSNALEHVPEVTKFFESAWKLIKNNGTLIIAVPPVVDELSKQGNIINPYHLNIWTPRQWYAVLSHYFDDVQCYRHSFSHTTINLDFANTPENTIVTERDFYFEPISVDEFYKKHTLTVIFVAHKPKVESAISPKSSTLKFIDESFTRPFIMAKTNYFTKIINSYKRKKGFL